MELGLVSIQRCRAKYLVEWFAFHYVVGFRKFYFYAHMSNDGTNEVLRFLCRKLDIKAHVIKEKLNQVQLMAYQHTLDNYINEVDWIAFIDGDEFLFPTAEFEFQTALAEYSTLPISAVAAFNVNFGSNGHILDPDGLVIESYTRCGGIDHGANRRVKSIIKGRQKASVTGCSNVFNVPLGTFDENLRPITWGYMPDLNPTYQKFRFNHYMSQSREFYETFKKMSGHADAGADNLREEDWWRGADTNDFEDTAILKYSEKLSKTINWLYS